MSVFSTIKVRVTIIISLSGTFEKFLRLHGVFLKYFGGYLLLILYNCYNYMG